MNKQHTPTLDEATEAVRKLPEDVQTAIAQEILAPTREGALPPEMRLRRFRHC